jgi:PrtD family type I secretion system ABC transporter
MARAVPSYPMGGGFRDMTDTGEHKLDHRNALSEALLRCRSGFVAIAAMSLVINVLMLTAPLYMLQVFDRVLTSQSVETLLYLTLLAGFAFLVYWGLDMIRRGAMVTIGTWLDARVGGDTLFASLATALGQGKASVQGLRDLGTLRTFLTGPAIFPILDAPWTPLFLAVLFLLHPLLGWLSLAGALVLFFFALANEYFTRTPIMHAAQVNAHALEEAQAAVRNADVAHAMGMVPNLIQRWNRTVSGALLEQGRASRIGGMISATSKFIRQALQVMILGVGAWLVLAHELTPGGMIAGSILMARALAPIEQSIEAWRSAIAARAAYHRLGLLLSTAGPSASMPPLPHPKGDLAVEDMSYAYGGEKEPMLRRISFKLNAGESLGLIGPTASGKTTLARLIIGNLAPQLGRASLDGADMATWPSADRGKYVGYMPQDVELFAGTVRENICRFGDVEPETVYTAARIAGAHEDILVLPLGYETQIGVGGMALSGGQRQKIALARAVFGQPKLVVLDEPNSNMDMAGEAALTQALSHLRSQGTTTIIIAHRPGVLRSVDKILVLREGAIEMMGPRDEVFARVSRPQDQDAKSPQQSRHSRVMASKVELAE